MSDDMSVAAVAAAYTKLVKMNIDIRCPNISAHDNYLWLNWQWLRDRDIVLTSDQSVSIRDRDGIVCTWHVVSINEQSNTVLCERRHVPVSLQ